VKAEIEIFSDKYWHRETLTEYKVTVNGKDDLVTGWR
jgi:hypothetical protein